MILDYLRGVKLIFILCQVTTTVAAFRHVYYVQTTTKGGILLPSMQCPGNPCHPLTYYLQRSDQFFRSDSVFYFMSGVHLFQIDRRLIDNSVMISDVQNLALIGSSYVTRRPTSVETSHFTVVEPTTHLVCNSYNPAALVIINVANLKIANIALSGCGRALRNGIWDSAMNGLLKSFFPPMDLRPRAAIFMSKVRSIEIKSILVQNSTGYGLLGINILGSSRIHNSAFLHNNNHATDAGGNALIVYISSENCDKNRLLERKELQALSITSTQFMLGLGNGIPPNGYLYDEVDGFIGGGGLTIMVTPADFMIRVDIQDTVTVSNSALFKADGINLWIIIHGKANSIIHIHNLTSISGRQSNVTSLGGSNSVGFSSVKFPHTGCEMDNHPRNLLQLRNSFFSHNSVALYISLQVVRNSIILDLLNCSFSDNEAHIQYTAFNFKQQNSLIRGMIPIFSLNNCNFTRSKIKTESIIFQSADFAIINNCQFFDNHGTAIAAFDSHLYLGGNITFRNNTGYNGGALALWSNSYVHLLANSDTTLTFINNHAIRSGGAVYINSRAEQQLAMVPCIFQIYLSNLSSIRITAVNNTAGVSGSFMYGGLTGSCKSTLNNENRGFEALKDDLNIKHSNNDMSVWASDPTSVVRCENQRICSCGKVVQVYEYPGREFYIELGATGRGGGLSPAAINSTLINTNSTLGPLQHLQDVGNTCKNLTYTIFSDREYEQMKVQVGDYAYYFYQQSDHGMYLTVDIHLHKCPAGFHLSPHTHGCDCNKKLQKYKQQKHNVTCNINDQTFQRQGLLWIYKYPPLNETLKPTGIVVHEHCPFDYCNHTLLKFNLSNPDKQCTHGRTGILCGSCEQGLGLTLGRSRCTQCSSKYIALILLFAFFGLALVIFLTVLNFTVSVGTMNGLVFYANIVRLNLATFFPTEAGPLQATLTIFIAWLNLDFGVDICFSSSLNAYTLTWLQFVFPIYVWIIVGGMIVISSRCSIAVKLLGMNAVSVLATLLLLSYAKLLRTIIAALSFTLLHFPDKTTPVWLYNGNVMFLQGKHIPLFITPLGFALLFIVPYTVLLLFIPCLLAKSDRPYLKWVNKIMPLLDAYQGPYKRRYRYWTGLMLIVRNIIFIVFAINIEGDINVNLLAITMVVIFLLSGTFFTGPVYKNKLVNAIELFFILNLGLLSCLSLYVGQDTTTNAEKQTYITCAMVGSALLVFFFIIIFHVHLKLKRSRNISCYKRGIPQDRGTQQVALQDRFAPTVSLVELRESLLSES